MTIEKTQIKKKRFIKVQIISIMNPQLLNPIEFGDFDIEMCAKNIGVKRCP